MDTALRINNNASGKDLSGQISGAVHKQGTSDAQLP
jgi:hypothetical protein